MLFAALAATPAPEPEPPRELAIFTAPFAVVNSWIPTWRPDEPALQDPTVFIPIGFTFPISGRTIMVEAAFTSHRAPNLAGRAGWTGFWISISFPFSRGDLPLNGAYLAPRLTLGGFQVNTFRKTERIHGATILDVMIGAEFGYQRTFGPLFLGVLIGVSTGAGLDDVDFAAGPSVDPFSSVVVAPNGHFYPVIALDLQFLRIGYAF